jgi:hypothetical protein
MNLKEIGYADVDWIYLAQDCVGYGAFVNNTNFLKCGEFLDYLSDYKLLKDSAP